MKASPIHLKPPRVTADNDEELPGGRPLSFDSYERDYRLLDRLSRVRALTLPESLRLEECVRVLDRRAGWRLSKRQRRGQG